jgi:hypothetical protein
VSEDQVLGAMLYILNFGHKVRLVLNSLGVSRALLWLTVLRDGSVVLGLSRAASDVLRGEQESGGQREVRVNFADAEPVTDPQVLRKLHATFHPSGGNQRRRETALARSLGVAIEAEAAMPSGLRATRSIPDSTCSPEARRSP